MACVRLGVWLVSVSFVCRSCVKLGVWLVCVCVISIGKIKVDNVSSKVRL